MPPGRESGIYIRGKKRQLPKESMSGIAGGEVQEQCDSGSRVATDEPMGGSRNSVGEHLGSSDNPMGQGLDDTGDRGVKRAAS